MSRTIRSGACFRTYATASSPLETDVTPYPRRPQHGCRQIPLFPYIVHDEDCLSPTHIGMGRRGFGGPGDTLPRGGKVEGKDAPPPLLTLHVDAAVVVLHRSPDDGQTQSRTTSAHDLLGVEGFEDAAQVPNGDTRPVVGNSENRIVPLDHVIVAPHGPVQMAVFRSDDDLTPMRDGLRRVGDEVHHRLTQM